MTADEPYECDDYEEVLITPKYYYVDKEGERVYDTDLMFQHFEEQIEELYYAESRPKE